VEPMASEQHAGMPLCVRIGCALRGSGRCFEACTDPEPPYFRVPKVMRDSEDRS